jgi:hypothetical protein
VFVYFAATGSLELGVLPASSGAKSIVKRCSSGDWFDAMLLTFLFFS